MKQIQKAFKLFVIVLAVAGSLCLVSAQAPADRQRPELRFNRAACEEECRRRYGYGLFLMRYPGRGDGAYWAYTKCLQDCNRRFWKEFDKEMDDMLK